MTQPADKPCPNCEVLQRRVEGLEQRLAVLEAELAKANKNSANSSKPPSSDLIKPPRPAAASGGKRKRGAQPGHPRHERIPFAPDEIDHTFDYCLTHCPDCGGELQSRKVEPRVVQQVEIVATPIEISEHRGHAGFCPCCQKVHYAEIPTAIR
ncbi:MAG TPA: DUF6444 domain-containing protein, partial [Pirellulales bacterium]|nr:DUF6444 domain-containing protein [Pirellulales bacterium]